MSFDWIKKMKEDDERAASQETIQKNVVEAVPR